MTAPEKRVFCAVFLALLLAAVIPLWVGRYLPLLDVPNHLASVMVWRYYDDPRYDFQPYYTLNLVPLPYWAHYGFLYLLAPLTGLEVANKIFLSLYAVALPTGALCVAQRFGRSPWLSLFAFPLIYNANLADGFIAFVGGAAALLFALVLLDRHFQRPSLGRGALALLLGTSLYFFHLLPFVLYLACGGLLLLLHEAPRSLRLLLLRVPPLLCAFALAVWAYRHANSMNFHAIRGVSFRVVFDPPLTQLRNLPLRLLHFLSSGVEPWVLGILVLSRVLLGFRSAPPPASPPVSSPASPPVLTDRTKLGETLRSYAPELFFAVALAASVLLPRSIVAPFRWYMINGRYVMLAALFGALMLRGPILGWRRYLMAPVVLATLGYFIGVGQLIWGFNQRAAGFDEVAAQVPPHKRTLVLSLPPLGDPAGTVNSYNQWPAYMQLRNGGPNHYNFADGFPMRYRRELSAPPWHRADQFFWGNHSHDWDYFLTHHERHPQTQIDLFGPLVAAGKVRLVSERGPWRLYEKLATPADPR